MKIAILTIFPDLFSGFLSCSLIQKAIERDTLQIELHNIRDFADPPHYKVDDEPYGGGPGMVMKPEPIVSAIERVKENLPAARVILLSPRGKRFTQEKASQFSESESLILVCGRYEGVDERAIEIAIDEELSIGDYVLMGGEIPAMVVIEAVSRLTADVLGNAASTEHESFSSGEGGAKNLLEAPQYTRPAEFRGRKTPEVLLSGDHARIATWREKQALEKTKIVRPDLLEEE